MKDLVGFYPSRAEAELVKNELVAAGYDHDHITLYDRHGKDEPGLWEDIKSAFGFSDEEDQYLYAEAARRGAVAVALNIKDDDEPSMQRAIPIMQRHGLIDLEKQSAQWRQQGWTGYQGRATTTSTGKVVGKRRAEGKEVIPVVQEELQVGKRAVHQGGVRVYSRVTERPVQEQVQLREEHVQVERRPVDRPISDADRAFEERTIEASETVEKPVVSKQARVVEEVVVNKDVQHRTETVKDTVRRTDVQVEQTGGLRPGEEHIGDEFATELARDNRYAGREWNTVEPEARRSFEQRYPGSKWEQFKDTIRRGYDRARRKV